MNLIYHCFSFFLQSENQFYLQSTFHTGLPINNVLAVFGSQVGPSLYKPNESKTPWRNLGDVRLKAHNDI